MTRAVALGGYRFGGRWQWRSCTSTAATLRKRSRWAGRPRRLRHPGGWPTVWSTVRSTTQTDYPRSRLDDQALCPADLLSGSAAATTDEMRSLPEEPRSTTPGRTSGWSHR